MTDALTAALMRLRAIERRELADRSLTPGQAEALLDYIARLEAGPRVYGDLVDSLASEVEAE